MVLHLTSSTGRPSSAPGDVEFVDLHRDLRAGGEIDRRMHADHDRDFEVLPARRTSLQMLPDVAARMQARSEAVRPFELQPLIAQIAHARVRILADQDAGADVAPGVLLKVAADRQRARVQLVPLHDAIMHGPPTRPPSAA